MVSSTAFAVLLAAALTFVSAARWQNDWEEKLEFTCEPNSGQGIYMIETDGKKWVRMKASHNHEKNFDRKWGFDCIDMGVSKDYYSCKWYSGLDGGWNKETEWINNFEESFNITCPNHGIVAGFKSVHSKNYEDRIWNVYCCTGTHSYGEDCEWRSPELNDEYDDWKFEFIEKKKFIRGVKSKFRNDWRLNEYNDKTARKDRQWEFEVCKSVNCWVVPSDESSPLVEAKKATREVNSVATSLNCNSRHTMEFEEGPETTLTNTVEISNTQGQEKSTTHSTSFTVGAVTKGSGPEMSLSAGGSMDFSKSSATEETNTKTYSTASTANSIQFNWFTGPSAMMIMSESDTYRFESETLTVHEVLECEGVEENTVLERQVPISVKTYGQTHFTTRYAKFRSEQDCVDNQLEVEKCLNQLRFTAGDNQAIARAFEECFAKRDSAGNVLYTSEVDEIGQEIPQWLDGVVDVTL